jgi:prevent-host-death family protein
MGITIGIRELRQHASRYLRRVRAGETITLADRGEPFAEIRPLPVSATTLDRLIAAGRVKPATADLAEVLEAHPPVPARPGQRPLSETVREMRDEERP